MRSYRWLRRILRVLLGILVFLFLMVLFVRSPWGQGIIVDKVVNFVSDKTNTKVAIDRLFITFDGDVQLDGLYLEDTKGDTLIYSKSLEANIPLWATINGEAVGVEALDWEGLRANIIRKDSVNGYNFQFLIDAFVAADTTSVATDTTSTPLNLILKNLNLKDIDIVFNDAVIGIASKYKIGELKAGMETIDLEQMIFNASELELTNANIQFIQNPAVTDTTSTDVPLPKLSAESLKLQNVKAYYQSKPNQVIADLDIGQFYTEIPQINLANSEFILDQILLKDSKILFHTETETKLADKKPKPENQSKTEGSKAFEWPAIEVSVADIDFENNKLTYLVGDARPVSGEFNPNAVAIEDLSLQAKDLYLRDEAAGLELNQFDFKEFSGFNLKQLAFKFELTNQQLHFEDLKFQLNDNSIQGYVELNYSSISKLMQQPENTKVQLNLPSFSLSLKELFKFQPSLEENEYLKTLSKKQIRGNINAAGTLAAINFPNININWGKNTKISASGKVFNPTNPKKLAFDIPQFSAETTRETAQLFLNEQDMGITFPKNVRLAGTAKGNLEDLSAEAKLTTTQGVATIGGDFKNAANIAFDLNLTIDDYKVNELLNNPQFGALTLNVKAEGSGKTINTLDATLDANITSFQLKGYAINDLNINGKLKNGQGHVRSNYKDDNLNANLDALVVLDSIAPEATLELDVVGANLQALGLMNRDVRAGLKLYADFKGNAKNYDVSAIIEDGVVVYDNKSYLLGAFDALAHVTQDTTSVSIRNKMLDLKLESNTDPQTFSKALQLHVSSYFSRKTKRLDTLKNPVNLKIEAKIAESPLLNDVFLVNVKELDTINVAVDFNQKARKLKANITAPHINYSGNKLDSLVFAMDTDEDNFKFDFGFKNLSAGPLDIPSTRISGNQTNNELSLNISGSNKGTQLMNVNSKITGNSERLRFHVSPDSLILNKKKWTIPEDNEVIITQSKLEFNAFEISRDNQSINITNKLAGIDKNHIAIEFSNFNIQEVFNYLNPDSQLAKGELNGNFVIEAPFKETGIVADLNIQEFQVLKSDLGTLSLDAKSLGNNSYDFEADMKGGDVDLDLKGDYIASTGGGNLDLDLKINKFKMEALNDLSMGEIKNASGNFSGQFKLTGETSDLQYQGSLNFNEAKFNVAKLNTDFLLKDETLNIDNAGLSMSNFTVLDANNNALVVSGEIGTERFINPTFNLDLKATNFQVLDATKEDNEMIYGKAAFDVNAKLTGDLQLPKLNAKLSLNSSTDVTYVLPSSVANVETRDGVVVFVNRENPDAILTQTKEETATVRGFDVSALIKINKNATATIIIDEDTGDNFKIKGEGDLNLTMSPNGRINLTGAYEISDGHYELTLYNLVNRKFNIAPGSRVTWSGDPFDAKLDVRAIYNIETSASPLMAAGISGSDATVKSKFRQVLPFNVYLNIDGDLMQPKISFQLDMPEEEQGAVGGQVYSRVQQVNQQESELNQQVFSLLVLNKFYPNSGSDGSSGGFANVARDNLNDAVSDQLNTFSDQVLGSSGIDLDFGLDSYTDYQGESPTQRTQLDVAAQKKLFDDRLIVRVGSQLDIQGSGAPGEQAPLVGNVSLEYLLTENGRYRLKGFRKSEFENVIDGQTIVSGIALIFTQEFNQFKDLWDAMLRSQSKKDEAEAEQAKQEIEKKQEATEKSMENKKN